MVTTLLSFLESIPAIVSYGCLGLLLFWLACTLRMFWGSSRAAKPIRELLECLQSLGLEGRLHHKDGLTLDNVERMRVAGEGLGPRAAAWLDIIQSNLSQYTSPTQKEGWFLTERVRELLSFDLVVGRRFNSSFYATIPGLLTAAGLTLTFIAILLALYGVRYDKTNTTQPISGIDALINGLSGKFFSSIIALLLSMVFTLCERFVVRNLRKQYEDLIAAISQTFPFLPQARILLDIQQFAAQQTVSISHISSEVVDRFVGAFNRQVVPALSDGMSSGVADKMQAEFRPLLKEMTSTLDGLSAAIVRLEAQKQDSVTGEIRQMMKSVEESLVNGLSKMGSDFHAALSGAASQEFGNVKGTLEGTRQMLSDMNGQFAAMQAAFAAVVHQAEQSTSDQMRVGREQTEALTSLMNGLMTRMQESADQNLGLVRNQLGIIVSDLADKVGSLSQNLMAAASQVAKEAQESASEVVGKTGEWSEATAKRLEGLLANIEARSKDFQASAQSLLSARDHLADLVAQNAVALERMADASRQVQTYSTGLSGQSEALKSLSQMQLQATVQLRDTSGSLRAALEHNEKMLTEYRRSFDGYQRVMDDLDHQLGKVLGTIQDGLSKYNQSIENNFKELVKIANPMISEASNLLQMQINELTGQLEELSSVISTSMERINGRR